jgi:hypothetical protein
MADAAHPHCCRDEHRRAHAADHRATQADGAARPDLGAASRVRRRAGADPRDAGRPEAHRVRRPAPVVVRRVQGDATDRTSAAVRRVAGARPGQEVSGRADDATDRPDRAEGCPRRRAYRPACQL